VALLVAPPACAKEAGGGPVIILKLDDLRGDARPGRAVHPRWQRVADLVEVKKIKASFGISGKALDKDDREFFEWAKALHARGAIEFWSHGYTHGKEKRGEKNLAEFQLPYERQRETLARTQRLAREKLGFEFRTFGAPFNAVDAATARALEARPRHMALWQRSARPRREVHRDRPRAEAHEHREPHVRAEPREAPEGLRVRLRPPLPRPPGPPRRVGRRALRGVRADRRVPAGARVRVHDAV
jgi:hypothetical protein